MLPIDWYQCSATYPACSFPARYSFLLINSLNPVYNCIYFILLERQGKKCLAQMYVILVHCSSSCIVRPFWKEKWHRFRKKNPTTLLSGGKQQSGLQNSPVRSCVGITEGGINWEVTITKNCNTSRTFQPEFFAKENAHRAIPPPLWVLC